MQKLEERNTYTPTGVTQARSNCGLGLNREETLSVQGLKTSSNELNKMTKKHLLECQCCGYRWAGKPLKSREQVRSGCVKCPHCEQWRAVEIGEEIPEEIVRRESEEALLSDEYELKSSKKVCACGCGQIIIKKTFHKYYGIPDYVDGHNKPIWLDKSRKKLSQSLKGKSRPKGWGKRHSEILKEGYKNGKIKLQIGKKMTKEAREKVRLANLGEKNPNWRGGKSFGRETYSAYFKKKLRYLVWERDKYICQLCRKKLQSGLSPNNSQILRCHHIDYVKKHNSMDNCITLCTSCNTKVNFSRDYWKEYFMERLQVV